MSRPDSRPAGASPTPAQDDDPRRWTSALQPYAHASTARAMGELLLTSALFIASWTALALCVRAENWWGLLLALPSAAFLVRLFMIQHDCGHGSYFGNQTVNDTLGRIIGVLTLTPYAYWRRTHAAHHATTGHLEKRGSGDVPTLTIAEYRALPRRKRLAYRLLRHPLVLLGFGPFYLFVLKYRVPGGLMRVGPGPWVSTMGTNLALVGLVVLAGTTLGWMNLLITQLPVTLLAGGAGIWLFYIQHQFEDVYWARDPEWNFHAGALEGSTHYVLPGPLRWLTANIGIHHVHHLASKIPFYRLDTVLDDHPELHAVCRLSLRESIACFRLALIDERHKRLVSFREAVTLPA